MLWSFFTAAQLLSKHMNPIGIQGVIPGCRVQNDLKHHVKITWHIASNKRCSRHHHTKHLPSPRKKICLSAKALLVEPAECSPDHTEPWHLKPRLSCSSKKKEKLESHPVKQHPQQLRLRSCASPTRSQWVYTLLMLASPNFGSWKTSEVQMENGDRQQTSCPCNGVLVLNPHREPHFCRETSWLLPLRCP